MSDQMDNLSNEDGERVVDTQRSAQVLNERELFDNADKMKLHNWLLYPKGQSKLKIILILN